MPTNIFPIVGAFYRPPAKALIDALAIGTPLVLIAEPENMYDPNAIAVWLSSVDIPRASYEKLEEILPPYGYTLEQVLQEESWHLGYIKKELAAELRSNETVGSTEPVDGQFRTSSSGSPMVKIEV